MLRELSLQRFGLFEEAHLVFAPGLNVISGASGSGKTMLLAALELLLGGRAAYELAGMGQGRSVLTAVFAPGPQTLARLPGEVRLGSDGLLRLSRELAAGKSAFRIGDQAVPRAVVRALGRVLADVCSQGEGWRLAEERAQLELLDAYGGLEDEAARLAALEEEARRLRREEAQLGGDPRERARRLDLLRYQVEEIEGAGLKVGEEEELLARRRRLLARDKVRLAAEQALAALEGTGRVPGALARLAEVERPLAQARELEPLLGEAAELLQAGLVHLEEARRALGACLAELAFDPRELEAVEERLELYRALQRKYGEDTASVLAFAREAREEMERLAAAEERLAALAAAQERLQGEIQAARRALWEHRRQAAHRLSEEVGRVLEALGFPPRALRVDIEEEAGDEEGRVLLGFQPNPGQPPRPLGRIASGGELARVLLALWSALAARHLPAVLVFDEIDAGVGGEAAQAVARQLQALAQRVQVVAVTHQPVVAAAAARHFRVDKVVEGGRTKSRVRLLAGEERVAELARMLGGDERTARAHAERLIARAPA